MPRASRRSVLNGMAYNAPFTWRVSINTASSPAAHRCRCSHCDKGPDSSPMPVMLTSIARRNAINASGSQAIFASRATVPDWVTTQTALLSQ